MLKVPESSSSSETRSFDNPIYVIREMDKIGENYPKYDTRKMGSLLSSYYAFDVKREDKVEVGGMGRLANVLDGDNVRQGLCRDLSFSPYHEGTGLKTCGGYPK